MFYYAEIDSNCKVVNVYGLDEQSAESNYVAITQEQYESGNLVGKYYNKLANTFEIVGDNIGSSDWVNYRDTQQTVSTAFDNLSYEVSQKAEADHTHDIATENASGLMGYDDKTKLNGIETGANNYTHPATHSADMITGLSDVATSGDYNDLSNKPVIPEQYTHPETHPASMVTGLSPVATSGSYDDLNDKPTIPTIPTSLPANGGNADTVDGKHATDFANANHNHNTEYAPISHSHSDYALATDIDILETEINGKADSVHTHAQSDITGFAEVATSGDYNDLSNKPTSMSPTAHTHPMSDVVGLLDVLLTDNEGGVNFNITSGDMLNIIKSWDKGIYTAYFMGGSTGCTNVPKTAESWRCMAHKTGAVFGWVIAFGTSGSVFTNYLDNGTWKGWKAIFDVNPSPLWGTSGYYMTAGHTVVPTKKLSECQHGWVLLWSDFDKDTATTNDKDFCTTIIPKVTPTGGTWSNKLFYCDIPRYVGDNTSDIDTERRIIKQIYISDNKIVGHDANNLDERHDVVLRAVYEF